MARPTMIAVVFVLFLTCLAEAQTRIANTGLVRSAQEDLSVVSDSRAFHFGLIMDGGQDVMELVQEQLPNYANESLVMFNDPGPEILSFHRGLFAAGMLVCYPANTPQPGASILSNNGGVEIR